MHSDGATSHAVWRRSAWAAATASRWRSNDCEYEDDHQRSGLYVVTVIPMAVKTVGVVGAGTMGSGIAQVFAQSGFAVRLVDVAEPMLVRARDSIGKSLGKFVEKGTIPATTRDATLERLTTAATLGTLVDADYIVEAIVEDREAKQSLFSELDKIARPGVVLASNTSSIPIGTLAAATTRPDCVLGMHFMNPVPLVVLVEVIRSAATSDASMKTAFELCQVLGKIAVESADRPGFIAN